MPELDRIPEEFTGRPLVAGAGVSGLGCAALLAAIGSEFAVADDNPDALAKVAERTAARTLSVAQARDRLSEFDVVVTSPGWRPDSPLLVDAALAGLEVIGDVELAWRLDQAGVFGAPREWLGVTGTNGKTTTTSMLAAIMGKGERPAVAVGNIGVSVADALLGERVDVLCAELSSFQLHWSSQLRPSAGVLLNLADDHLDWHGGFADYASSKGKILCGELAVVPRRDDLVEGVVDTLRSAGTLAPTVVRYTDAEPREGEVGTVDGRIVDRAFADRADIAGVEQFVSRGEVLDAVAATAIARSHGVTPKQISEALAPFHSPAHRGQVVHEVGGVRFIDNSKATNPHAAAAAMAGLQNIIWIAGGQVKGADVAELIAEHGPQVKAALLLGKDRELIRAEFARQFPGTPVVVTDSTDKTGALAELLRGAEGLAAEGDTVLLAPAAASLDMYRGMSERGDIFADLAKSFTPGGE